MQTVTIRKMELIAAIITGFIVLSINEKWKMAFRL